MNIDDEAQTKEFRSLLEELRKQLLDASIHFDIWEALWPTEKVAGVLDKYRGFFLPTRNAHLSAFFIKVCNIVSNDPKSPSFYRVLSMLNKDGALAPNVDVMLIKQRLNGHKPTLKAIKRYRDTRAAHWDTTNHEAERKPVLFGDSRRMLTELQDIFNEICGAVTRNHWSFELSPRGDSELLLKHLSELRSMHKQRINEFKSRVKS